MNRIKHIFLLACGLAMLISCGSDDESIASTGNKPVQELEETHIKSEAGRTFTINGTLSDELGLQSVQLVCPELYLDKTIALQVLYPDTILRKYDLSYSYKLPKDIQGEPFLVQVQTTNLAGDVSETEVKVTLDGDFVAPRFVTVPSTEITVLIKAETALNLRFEVTDDKALAKVALSIPDLEFTREFDVTGTQYSFDENVVLPSTPGTYTMTITAIDAAGLEETKTCTIKVSEMPDFEKMYLTDVSDAALLNSDIFGIPQLINRIDAYTYRAEYYTQKANTAIRFIPQKTDFGPICFGPSIDDATVLGDNPEASQMIILPEAHTYYAIEFNILTGAYSVESFVPDATPVPIGEPMWLDSGNQSEGTIPLEIGLVGEGLPGAANWSPSNPQMLTQDEHNPFLFYAEFNLEAESKVRFIISAKHSWGWWPEPYWRWNDSTTDPESNVSNGGENPGDWIIPTTGTYRFEFDSYLLRSRLYPITE